MFKTRAFVFAAVQLAFAAALAAQSTGSGAAGRDGDGVDRASLQALVDARTAVQDAQRAATEARAAELGLPLRVESPDGTIIELARFSPEGRPLYRITDNLTAARSVSTDDVWAGGSAGLSLSGAGQNLAIWDGGSIRITHQDLTGRATLADSATLSNHSNHVAGTMIGLGVNPNGRGMANGATIRSWDFNDDEPEMAAAQLTGTPPSISNHSYGFLTGWRNGSFGCSNGNDPQWYFWGDVTVSNEEDLLFGLYEETSATWDQIAFDSPDYLIFKSAGNDRGEGPATQPIAHCQWNGSLAGGAGDFEPSTTVHPRDGGATGFDTIGGGAGSAKNIMTIGAVEDLAGGYAGPASVVMSNFSGWGPVDDGRIKPDVVANGVTLTSAVTTSNTAYGVMSGTSMSTPSASGSVALIRQHALNLGQVYRGATFKAIAIHSADEAGANPGPDYAFGWGLLNTASAAALITANGNTSHILQGSLANGASATYSVVVPAGGGALKATLVWSDPPGPAAGATTLDPPTLRLVNDLDLEVALPGGGTASPWILDPASPASAATTGDNDRDNVEQILIATPAPGVYTFTLDHEGTITDGPQLYSLILTGGRAGDVFADGFELGSTLRWSLTLP